tara:strand:- start:356 stop:754 length:399 start_codon:yes stop_codon:yes gene_type:complete
MKKSELKKVLKPLIKECIREAIFDEGVLSGIIKEVAQGVGANMVVESRAPKMSAEELREKEQLLEMQRQERIRALNESAKVNSDVNVFENLEPIPSESQSGHGALSGVSSNDPGVDIDGIMNIVGNKWRRLA